MVWSEWNDDKFEPDSPDWKSGASPRNAYTRKIGGAVKTCTPISFEIALFSKQARHACPVTTPLGENWSSCPVMLRSLPLIRRVLCF